MSKVKVAVIYYSTYGTNHEMAEVIAEAAREAGAEVRLRKAAETAPEEVVKGQDAWQATVDRTADIPEAEPDDMEWANAFFFSSPTRYGGAASQMRAFIDTLGPLWLEGKLANKAATASTSAQNPHGGQETTIQTLYTTFMHWGAIIVPPGYTDPAYFASGGNPYGVSVATDAGGVTDEIRASLQAQTRRLVEVAERLAEAPIGAETSGAPTG